MSDATVAPVFLLATERSGSNLVRSILDTHTEVTAPHPLETAYPWRKTARPGDLSTVDRYRLVRDILVNKYFSFHPLVDTLDIDRAFGRLEDLGGESVQDVQQALYEEYASVVGASTWVSKDPEMWDYLSAAFDYYDDLRVVYLVRDARDTVLSFKRSNVGEYHPYYTARRWADEQRRGLELLDEHPDSVHRIRYEDLLRDPEAVVEGICEFLELAYEPAMMYYYDTDDVREASESAEVFENLSNPIQSDNYDKYKQQLPDEEVRITEKIAGDELANHGYDRKYTDEELDGFELTPETYADEERRIARSAAISDWRENTREQFARYATRSFSYYMILRYGLLA